MKELAEIIYFFTYKQKILKDSQQGSLNNTDKKLLKQIKSELEFLLSLIEEIEKSLDNKSD